MDSAAIDAAKKKAGQAGFNDMEISAIGEVANITLGNAMTALSMLLNNNIDISTPFVEIKQKGEIVEELAERSVVTRVDYVKGLDGYSVLFLKEDDVKIMTDLMMGSDGHGMFYEQELSELHLSAVSESMNQMMGSAATAMGMMLDKLVDISTPATSQEDPGQYLNDAFPREERFVQISFDVMIGELITTQMMQLYPFRLAKAIADLFIVKRNQNEGALPF